MSTDKEQFREQFCKAAAQLGLTPSELVSLVESLPDTSPNTKQAAGLGAIVSKIKDIGFYGTLATGGAGMLAGGGAAYLYNKLKQDLDVDQVSPVSSGLSKAEEEKALHLMAKYRDAIKQLKYSLKNKANFNEY